MNRRLLIAWILTGTAILALAIGPARSLARQSKIAAAVARATGLAALADAAQQEAARANIRAVEARRIARRDNTAESAAVAASASRSEADAQLRAQDAWAESLPTIEAALSTKLTSDARLDLEILRCRARAGAGDIAGAATELERLLEEAADADRIRHVRIREELSANYYHGARLMRQLGRPENEWRLVSDRARQHARVLAEGADVASAAHAKTTRHQRNLEIIIDFEQRGPEELEGTPLPDRCPGGNCRNLNLDTWPWSSDGKKHGRNNGPRDQRGAGDGEGHGGGS